MLNSQFKIFTDEFTQNPYNMYSKLRELEPIYKTRFPDGQEGWLITRYEDAVEALREPRFIKDISKLNENSSKYKGVFMDNMLFSDPPDHKRLRGLTQKAFTPQMIALKRERIKEITNSLLDNLEGEKKISLINDFAFPLPIIVISEILGVPSEDRDKFRIWSKSLIEGSSYKTKENSLKDMIDFIHYLNIWFKKVRQNPGLDLISQLIFPKEGEDQLTERELYGVVILLIVAGHETTVNLIGNSVLALLNHPGQFKLLKEQPHLIHKAIEESLRFNGPVEFSTSRWAIEDMVFKEKKIQKGELVIISLNSANHDSTKFMDPELFDITKERSPHLAFGKGIHQCLGAPLAKLEGEIAIQSLIERFPNMKLAISKDKLEWRPGMIVRGVKELPIYSY